MEPVSAVDWPGEISTVIHVKGCNMKCPYCFNKDLISFDTTGWKILSEDEAIGRIPKKVEHVVITGGEPFAQRGIIPFIHRLKSKGFKVSVQTNGSRPELLESVIYTLDYVAMDVKDTLDSYSVATGITSIDTGAIFDSIVCITDHAFPHEFRTTAYPGISGDDIKAIGTLLTSLGAKAYYLQKYVEVRDKPIQDYLTRKQLEDIASTLPIVKGIRG